MVHPLTRSQSKTLPVYSSSDKKYSFYMMQFPSTYQISNTWAMDYAIAAEDLDAVKYLYANGKDCSSPIYSVNLDIIKFLHSIDKKISQSSVESAIHMGHLELVKCHYAIGSEFPTDPIAIASCYRHTDIIKLLLSLGIDTNMDVTYAIEDGSLAVLEYFHRKGTPFSPDSMDYAAGHIDIVHFLYSIGLKPTSNLLTVACKNGNFPLLNYLTSIA